MRDLSSQIHWLNARLHIVVAMVIALLAAVGFGVSAGEGDFRFVYAALMGAGVVAVMGVLGEKYWLLVPFSLTCQLPAFPVMRKMIELPEIMITLCTITFAARFALKRQKFTVFQAASSPMLLYIAWVMMVFYLNPVGLEAMGADTGGARFYAKLLLALASYLIVVNQRITDRDCKTIVVLALVGSLLTTANNIYSHFNPNAANELAMAASMDPEAFYTWHQNLAVIPLMVIMLLLSRFRSSELFSMHRVGLMILIIGCCGLVLLSGKRAALAAIPLFFVAAAFIRKEYGFVLFWMGSAFVGLAAILALHGSLFTLPLVAQRSLSWLPGRWDASLENMQGGRDDFREGLRELAIEKIERDPWIGKGYAVDRVLAARLASIPGLSTEKLVLMMASGSSWHNTWLGYSADFGIPAAFLQAVIYLYIAWLGWWLFLRLPTGSMTQMVVMYVVLFTIRDIGGSHYGGHSSLDAFGRWWMYGVLISIALATRDSAEKAEKSEGGGEVSPARKRLSSEQQEAVNVRRPMAAIATRRR